MENDKNSNAQVNLQTHSGLDAMPEDKVVEITDADLMKLNGGTTPICWASVAAYSVVLAVSVVETTKEIT